MALIDFKVLPGIDKQDTTAGAEQRWVDSDNVRFRYGLPEKVGGWASLVTDTIVGVARREFAFVDLDGNRYVAIGTDKFLLIYFEGQLYDITPLKATLSSATIATTDTSAICSITTGSNHNLSTGDIVLLDNVTLPGGTGYANSDFEDKLFQVTGITSATVFTITQSTAATGTVATGGSIDVKPYEQVGPAAQSYGYGWGTDTWGTGGWGDASSANDVSLEPGLWSLSNFGQVLIATIANGKTFTWNSGDASRLTTRASTTTAGFETTNNPTASRVTLVSPTTRHLIHLGTETTIGDTSTQDDMFIRFSDQENINLYAPTAINTAGTQRLQDGTKIIGSLKAKEVILIWTDNALYTMKFVGSPFTFGFEQVGTNCGLIGESAAIEVDGTAYWMSDNGFFRYAGNLESMVCLVEDYVFDDLNTTANQLITAGLNNLFGEITWFYCTSGSTVLNRCVTYNYTESSPQRPVWTTGSLARTTWVDSAVFGKPQATAYDNTGTSYDVIGNTDGSTIYYEHERGTDQVTTSGITTVTSNIQSGDFDISPQQGLQGDGDYIMKIRRFIPDFLSQTGDTQITLNLRDYPNQSQASSPLGPFTINSSTTKVDTRARARSVALKVANTGASQDWKLGAFRLDIQPDGRR